MLCEEYFQEPKQADKTKDTDCLPEAPEEHISTKALTTG